jgi:isoleucyl-tRNA synthetase
MAMTTIAMGVRHGLKMTTTCWRMGSFRPICRSSAARAILKPNGKEGDANKRVIDKLVEAGACSRAAG